MSEWAWSGSSASGSVPVQTISSTIAALDFVGLDPDLYSLSLPANTTISSYIRTLLDAPSSATARSTLEISSAVQPVEYIYPTNTNISSAVLGNTNVFNNYGQAATNIIYKLPTAAAALRGYFVIGTTRAGNFLYISAQNSDLIILDGVSGSDGGSIYTEPTQGAVLLLMSLQTGLAAWDWIAFTIAGTWTASPYIYVRVTSTGDRRVTSTGDVRVI